MSQLPTHISHYEIRRVIGQGGMGTVYLALDPGLQRQVALKVLRADTDDQRERFRREARIVARLQHPNIVAIYAVGEHEQQPFIAMEYIEGEPLSDGIKRRAPWSLGRKLQMGTDLCAGLAFAHRAGVVHRDVKPSNLMVANGTGTVRLLDFGIARGVDAAATMGLTMHGNIVGTLNYMSPEQITGQPLDHRSDIFAVGLVLYELLTYKQAFPGDNLATLTYLIVHGQARPIRELQPDLDADLCAVVERAMARSPDDRFPHLESLRTELLRVAARLSPEMAAQVAAPGTGTTPAAGQPLIWSRALDPTISAEGRPHTRSTARVPDEPQAPAGAGAATPRTPATRGAWTAAAAISVIAAGGLALWLAIGRTPPTGDVTGPGTEAPSRPSTEEPGAGTVVPPPGPTSDTPGDGAATASTAGSVEPDRPTARENSPKDVPPKDERAVERPRDSGNQVVGERDGQPTPPAVANPAAQPTSTPTLPSGRETQQPPTPTPVVVTPPPPPVVPSDEDQVRAAITRWERAYAARDARGVDDVQPGSERAYERQFDALRSMSASLSGCTVSVRQGTATADCSEQYSWELKVGGGKSSGTRRRTFSLDKSSGTWRITGTRVAG